jgi:hypothetical protein
MTTRISRRTQSIVLFVVASLLLSASLAAAHGGDTSKVHACADRGNGGLRMIKPDESCRPHETAVDWSTGGAGNFELEPGSVTGQGNNLPDGPVGHIALATVGRANLVDGAVTASKVSEEFLGSLVTEQEFSAFKADPGDIVVASELAAALEQFKSDLGDLLTEAEFAQFKDALDGSTGDQTPNDADDMVSFNEVKDLMTAEGHGRITGNYIADQSLTRNDLAPGSVTTDRQTANFAAASNGSNPLTLPGGTETSALFASAQLTIPHGRDHMVLLTGQAMASCNCSATTVELSYALYDGNEPVSPVFRAHLSDTAHDVVLPISILHRAAPGNHSYDLRVTARYASGSEDVATVSSGLVNAVDVGLAS